MQVCLIKGTARSWDSFKDTLIKVLGEFKSKTVFEWGPGVSTKIMEEYPSVELIDTVEHDIAWHEKWKEKFSNKVNLMFEKDFTRYVNAIQVQGLFGQYDLIFVDGREREKCLDLSQRAISENGIIILHDAERESYQPWIKQFRFIFFEDNGNTAIMTNSEESNKRLERLFLCE